VGSGAAAAGAVSVAWRPPGDARLAASAEMKEIVIILSIIYLCCGGWSSC
jgi:hypothetical protein